MPTVINNALIDILPLILKSGSDKCCYLCSKNLHNPKKVENYPPEYQICCLCKKTLKIFAKNGLSYFDITELIDSTIEKIILSQGRLRRRDFTKIEVLCLQLLSHIQHSESQILKQKLKSFFVNIS